MGWMKDFENWTKGGYTFGDLEKDVKGFKILKMPVKEAAVGAGEKTRSQIMGVLGVGATAGKSLIGPGATSYLAGEQGYYPDWVPGGGKGEVFGEGGGFETLMGWGKDVKEVLEDPSTLVDTSGEGGGLINISVPEGMITLPEVDISGIGTGIGTGMASIGTSLAGALAGMGGIPQMPQMPQMPSLTDDEGKPDLVMIAALAAVGLGGVYLISKR